MINLNAEYIRKICAKEIRVFQTMRSDQLFQPLGPQPQIEPGEFAMRTVMLNIGGVDVASRDILIDHEGKIIPDRPPSTVFDTVSDPPPLKVLKVTIGNALQSPTRPDPTPDASTPDPDR